MWTVWIKNAVNKLYFLLYINFFVYAHARVLLSVTESTLINKYKYHIYVNKITKICITNTKHNDSLHSQFASIKNRSLNWKKRNSTVFNLIEQKLFFFLILAQPVYKMWIIQEPNTLELWNKLHFEEKKTESIHHV
jgi:hypothetical protein